MNDERAAHQAANDDDRGPTGGVGRHGDLYAPATNEHTFGVNHANISRHRIALWYERARRPALIVAALIFLLYAPFVSGGFVIDDHRILRHLEEYDRGERPRLDLYKFLGGGEENQRLRAEGWYPWWLADEVRYRHLRPVSEAFIYGEFKLFGRQAIGYRLVNLAFYVAGCALLMQLFRKVGGDERLARWGGVIFAVAASHAIPVVFVSAQCDLLALTLGLGAMLLAIRFIHTGVILNLAGAATLFALGMGTKEAILAITTAPLAYWLVARGVPGAGRRAITCSGVFASIGLAFLGFYIRGGYGSNASVMLDPAHAPVDYLVSMPGRVVVLLVTWFISINPFVFYFRPEWMIGLYVYGAIGGVALLFILHQLWKHHRRQRGVATMALWTLPFLPLLACTVPDDRIMMLPGIGLTYLAAAWVTRPHANGSQRLQTIPGVLFISSQIVATLVVAGIMGWIGQDSHRVLDSARQITELRRMTNSSHHGVRVPPAPIDQSCIFFVNAAQDFQPLFAQDAAQALPGWRGVRVTFLTDVPDPILTVVDSHTIRLEAGGRGMLGRFLGQMGRVRGRPRRIGDEWDAGEFSGRITRMVGEDVREAELKFKEPLSSDRYHFLRSTISGPVWYVKLDRMGRVDY